MARADIRSDGRPVPMKHATAKGDVPRNSGNFTRGRQLLNTQVLMWLQGIRIPLMFWFGIMALTYAIVLAVTLDENNIQLICMRILSTLWNWVVLDPYKDVRLAMPDGSIRHTIIGYVPYVPDVALAWDKAVRGLVGSMLFAVALSGPATVWYVGYSRRRGESIIADRHERGAMLVERDLLYNEVARHDRVEFEKEAASLYPDLTPQEVLALPFAVRKAGGIRALAEGIR